MTSVNVTTTKNTVTVSEGDTRIVTIKTQGPQGPSLPDGDKGDVTVSSNGTAISINNSAVTSAKIADGAIVDADINASAAIALTKLATGALPTAITVTSANISDLSIVDADISASAAISLSKLATGALPTAITVTSANISDLSIVNADINASAAIAGTKISPDFGSQNIVTTGTAATGALGVTGNLTVSGTVDGVDVATRDALFGGLTSSSGVLSNGVTATTQSASDNSTKIATTAYTDTAISNLINGAPAALDTLNELAAALNDDAAFSTTVTNSIATKMPLAGGQFTGNVTFSGTQTVDGRDLSVDGAKLDGIESGATADQTKSDIDALGIAASTATTLATARTIAGVSFDGSANIDISYTNLTNKLSVGDGGLTQNNFTDALKTKLDGVETGATADQTASEIKTAYESNSDTNAFTDADHTKLDGIEASATADQTAAEIKILLDSNGIVNSNVDASAAIAGSKIDPSFTSNLQITRNAPTISFNESDASTDYEIKTQSGVFKIKEQGGSDRLSIASDGTVDVDGNLDVGAGVDVTGNITVSGTVDGVDIATRDTLFGGLTSSSGVLTNGVIATTQSASDNSTKVATTAYTDTAVANLVDSAPGTLNTLNELAAALGDDPNFATTVTNSIATKLPLAGGQITGNITCSGSQTFDGRDLSVDGTKLDGIESNATADQTASEIVALVADQTIAPSTIDMEDNEKIQLGTGDDLQIFHTGTASKINNATGSLLIQSDAMSFHGEGGSETMAVFAKNGAVELHYDNGKKLETTANGVKAHGELRATADLKMNNADSQTIYLGMGNDLRIFHDGTDSYLRNETGELRVQADDFRVRNNANNHTQLYCNAGAQVELYYDNSKKLHTVADGIYVTGNIYSNKTGTAAAISLTDNGRLAFGSGADLQIYHDGSNSRIHDAGTGILAISGNQIDFQSANQGESLLQAVENGAVKLRYDNSLKFETTSAGATVTGALATTSLSATGGITGTGGNFILGDSSGTSNNRIKLGASGDLQIYHASNIDKIESNGAGMHIRQINNGDVHIHAGADSSAANNRIVARSAGAAELYHSGTKKFETLTNGIKVDGNIFMDDNNEIRLGDSGDFQLFHNSSTGEARIFNSNAAGINIITDLFNVKNNANNETLLKATNGGAVELYHDNSKKLETTSTGATLTGALTTTGNINVPTANSVVTGSVVTTNATALTAVDNGTAYFGTGLDLRISHTGTNSYITNTTGTLFTLSNIFEVKGSDGNETHLKTTNDGAVELYYDNSVKLATTGAGVDINGNLNFDDNEYALFGNSNDLQIYHDGSNSYIQDTDQGNLFIEASAVLIRKNGTTENIAKFIQDGAVELYYDNSKRIETLAEGAKVKRHDGGATTLYIEGAEGANAILDMYADDGDDLADKFRLTATTGGTFYMQNYANNGWQSNIAYTGAGNVELYYDGSKKLETTSTGVSVTGNITATGSVSVPDSQELICGDSSDLRIFHDGTNNIIRSGSTPTWIQTDDTINLTKNNASEYLAKFIGDGGVELYYDNSRKFRTYSSGVKIASDSSSGRLVFEDTDGNFCWQLTGFDAVSSGSGGRGAFQDANGAIVLDMRASGGNIFSYNTIKLNGGGSVDNLKLILGASDDLQIYHDGTDSFLLNATGEFQIANSGSGNTIFLQAKANENSVKAVANGAVELYYDNAKKFETTADGCKIPNVDCMFEGVNAARTIYFDASINGFRWNDSAVAYFGTGQDLQIYHNGNNSFIEDSGTGDFYIRGADNIRLQSYSDNEDMAKFIKNGAVELYYDNNKQLQTTADGIDIQGHITLAASNNAPKITFDENGANDPKAEIQMDQTSGTDGHLIFKTEGSGTLAERMRIANDGNVGIGKSSSSLDVDGSIFIGSGQGMNMVKSGSGGKIITLNRRTNVGLSIEFYRGSSVGSISHNNTSTAYNTTSDYRLKENVVSLSDAITRLKTLKPYRFNFIADKDVTVDGFIAHEVTAVPEAIQGGKDAVVTQAMVDNNEYEEERLGEIIPQGIDQSKLVPLLVAAVQELIGRVEKLEGA